MTKGEAHLGSVRLTRLVVQIKHLMWQNVQSSGLQPSAHTCVQAAHTNTYSVVQLNMFDGIISFHSSQKWNIECTCNSLRTVT